MELRTLVVILTAVLTVIYAAPVEKPNKETYEKAEAYLIKYDYLLEEHKGNEMEFQKALIRLQREDNGLEQTGKLDEETIKLMSYLRCDFGNRKLGEYRARSKWNKRHLTWNLQTTTRDMSEADQISEITRALKVWSDVSGLTFEQVPRNALADIELKFATGFHGDDDSFDGPGGTLAHAYFPKNNHVTRTCNQWEIDCNFPGDCHFDDAERFTMNSRSGINLFQVAAHELGHSLGLDHSADRNSLMAAFYRGYIRNFRLPNDDVRGIQSLYGQNQNNNVPQPTRQPNIPLFPNVPNNPQTPQRPIPRPPQRPNPRPPQRPNNPTPGGDEAFCQDSSIDAMFTLNDGRTYAFSGDQYYRFGDNGIDSSYPRTIADYWSEIPPRDIDAALQIPRGPTGAQEVWIFKGSQLYKYRIDGNGRFNFAGSSAISRQISNLPSSIDAIFQWTGNGKYYAFKGGNYWKLKQDLSGVEPGYPRNIRVWTQNSSDDVKRMFRTGVGAAIHYKNGKTYFFKGQNYVRWSDRPLQVERSYPRNTSFWWFGCRN